MSARGVMTQVIIKKDSSIHHLGNLETGDRHHGLVGHPEEDVADVCHKDLTCVAHADEEGAAKSCHDEYGQVTILVPPESLDLAYN